jgi:hypothetical protein
MSDSEDWGRGLRYAILHELCQLEGLTEEQAEIAVALGIDDTDLPFDRAIMMARVVA